MLRVEWPTVHTVNSMLQNYHRTCRIRNRCNGEPNPGVYVGMYFKHTVWLFAVCCLSFTSPIAWTQSPGALEKNLQPREFKVDGVVREALVYAPRSAKMKPTPVVFVYHGHGGSSTTTARSFRMHHEWPEAISVYPQGLKTPGRLTDPEGKRSGWQRRPGDQQDRDIKFFDAMLEALTSEYQIDKNRIYCTGHSNGGAFTYLLWESRGDILAAVAPSASAGPYWEFMKLTPKPVMHLAGRKDQLVKFEWQERTIEAIRKVNKCEAEGLPWQEVCTRYSSSNGPPVVAYIHDGAHGFPARGPALIASFFQGFDRLKQNP